MSGPLGPRFVSGWSYRRFNHLPQLESQALHDYSFSIFKQKGSGEYALAYILAPGAYARRPVINRIQEVGRQLIPQPDGAPPKRETGLPIVFMYGENDWMDVAGGLAAQEKLNDRRLKALLHGTDEEKRNENGTTKVLLIPKAGHHLYLDNPNEFNDMIRKELEETRADERRKRGL
jgi:cardiolipin-specific phospholipase